ncbi:MAG: DUF3618 domain-containing protein [Magnetospirillum sp.]|nr:DUF3618 domain-containing protein [Magnetospirillum sp.]
MTTDEIQQQIERTRGEMAGTLQAIERKLSPLQLLDQAVDIMRGLTSDGSQVRSMMREHPLPLALIGLGIGWLAVEGTLRARRANGEAYGKGEGRPAPSEPGYPTAAGAGSSGYGAEGEEGMASMAGETAASRIAQAAGRARLGIRHAREYTRQRVTEWGRAAGDTASGAANRTRDTYQEHPLVIGVAAAALGAVLGAVLPRTRLEGRLLAGTMGDVMRQARERGGELVERAGRVAKNAMRVAKPSGQARSGEQPSATMH